MVQYISSDLHFQPRRRDVEAVRALARYVVAEGKPEDVLILAGDYANTDTHVRECLRLFAGFRGHRLAVSGNHDVWTNDPHRDSWQRYQDLSRLYREEGFHALEDQPFIMNDGTAFVGSMGWYDYSFREESLGHGPEAYADKSDPDTGDPVWMDGVYVKWKFSDLAMTRYQLNRLGLHLTHTAKAEERVVVMHHAPTKALLFHPRELVPHRWKVANTFLGSECFADLLEQKIDVPTTVVNGHIHMAKTIVRKGITYASIGSSDTSRELLVRDGSTIARQTFS